MNAKLIYGDKGSMVRAYEKMGEGTYTDSVYMVSVGFEHTGGFILTCSNIEKTEAVYKQLSEFVVSLDSVELLANANLKIKKGSPAAGMLEPIS